MFRQKKGFDDFLLSPLSHCQKEAKTRVVYKNINVRKFNKDT